MSTPPDDTLVDSLVGHDLDEATRIATEAGWLVRALEPGAMMTTDFRESRVNLEHDADQVVTRAWVG